MNTSVNMNEETIKSLTTEEFLQSLPHFLVQCFVPPATIQAIQEQLENIAQASYTNGWFDAKNDARKQY